MFRLSKLGQTLNMRLFSLRMTWLDERVSMSLGYGEAHVKLLSFQCGCHVVLSNLVKILFIFGPTWSIESIPMSEYQVLT